jgi:NOL1/NOP2/sun family putative RNA methylase
MSEQDFQTYYKNLLGEKEFQKFLEALNKFYPKAFRINTLKWKVADFEKWAVKNNWNFLKIPFCKDGFYVNLPEEYERPLGNTIPHLAGYAYIQGATSMYPVEVLDVQKGDLVLDMCAAPGGKTTHIAQKLANTGFIVANEVDRKRLQALRENIERLSILNFAITSLHPSFFQDYYPNKFDKVLVDAPCSGEGMFSKSEEVMKKWSMKYIKGFAAMQTKILSCAFDTLKPEVVLFYST